MSEADKIITCILAQQHLLSNINYIVLGVYEIDLLEHNDQSTNPPQFDKDARTLLGIPLLELHDYYSFIGLVLRLK